MFELIKTYTSTLRQEFSQRFSVEFFAIISGVPHDENTAV